tara:strand:- start:402 stop:632 length:231 start_codon:yes stop_codon:yes gene_type:complete
MDIWLRKTKESTQIKIGSVHGMLWLQTHFEEEHWTALANNEVRIANAEIEEFLMDAKKAGLILNSLPLLSSSTSHL